MKKLYIFLVIAASIVVGFFSAISLSQIEIYPFKISTNTSIVDQNSFLQDVILRVKKHYVEEKSDKQLYEAAAEGILSSLDPHSSYLNEEHLKEMQVQTKGEFGGLGIEITLEMQVIKVVTAIEDTPAFKAGVKSGDYITKINGKTIVGQTIDEVVKKLRGKPGTEVAITIIRKGEKAPIEKTLKREIIKVRAVKSSYFNEIGYIKINSFSEQTFVGLTSEIKKLKDAKGELKGLVLDLRNNPGGLLDQAFKVGGAFLNKGSKIVSISGRDKAESKDYLDEEDENLIPSLPIVVLINEGSASASEIVAGALQDNKRAIIMGIKSFGKGSVQTVIPLAANNGALKMTTSLYYTPSGKSIQAHGIEPDIIVSADEKIVKNADKMLDRDSESDLKNHIEVSLQKEIEEAKKSQIKDDNIALYEQDYQLARAIDLLRGINVYKRVSK